jgi:hypothetical protein
MPDPAEDRELTLDERPPAPLLPQVATRDDQATLAAGAASKH